MAIEWDTDIRVWNKRRLAAGERGKEKSERLRLIDG